MGTCYKAQRRSCHQHQMDLKNKMDEDGEIIRNKSRLVA